MALPAHFEGEDVIITFEKEYITGDSTTRTNAIFNVDGRVLSWNVGGGSQPTEDVFAFGGKTFNFQKPREKFTVSFDVMINSTEFDYAQFGSSTSGAQFDSMTGYVVTSTDTTRRWRIIFWFQDSGSHVANSGRTIITPSKAASCYRMIFVDCKAVTFDKEFSADEYFKGTLNLEFSAADENGLPNMIQDDGLNVGTAAGTTLASMTTTAGKGIMDKARGYLDWSATTTPAWYAGGTTTDVANRYRNA